MRFLETSSSSEEIEGFTPASPVKCPAKHGTGNPFVTKFQATECTHCKDLYDYAIAKGEATGVTQTYDISVAKNLCSDYELGIESDEEDSNKDTILIMLLGGICLIMIFVLAIFCTREGWNDTRYKVEKAKGQPNIILEKTPAPKRDIYDSSPVTDGKKEGQDFNAHTSRHLIS
mmetsp:Transcript_17530/g.27019  ORF Transcript_17530/g.27019 Transcript_17530/m.27019 type:complete len:174 (-) Transcript_17530:569-1090(-)